MGEGVKGDWIQQLSKTPSPPGYEQCEDPFVMCSCSFDSGVKTPLSPFHLLSLRCIHTGRLIPVNSVKSWPFPTVTFHPSSAAIHQQPQLGGGRSRGVGAARFSTSVAMSVWSGSLNEITGRQTFEDPRRCLHCVRSLVRSPALSACVMSWLYAHTSTQLWVLEDLVMKPGLLLPFLSLLFTHLVIW